MKSFLVNIRLDGEPVACWESADPAEAFEVSCEYLDADAFDDATFNALKAAVEKCGDMVIGEKRDITEQHVTVRILCEEKEQEEGEE